MGSEFLLYGYGFVCLSMLLFNIVYNTLMKGSQRRLERRSGRMGAQVESQLRRLRAGEPLEKSHMARLQRKLSRVGNLIAFDRTMERQLKDGEDPAVEQYLRQFQPVILHLGLVYRRRESLQAAYFAYFLAKHKLKRRMPMDAMQEIMVDYMKKDSLYCRINALEALYTFGNAEKVAEAVALQDQSGSFLHEKVLTDGLLSFQGDHRELIRLLWDQLDRFTERTQRAILDYIRFQTGDYCPEMLRLMEDPKAGKELRLSAIRYFGRYHYEPARPALLSFASDPDPEQWEYAAVSVSVLAGYPGEDVDRVLMEAMHSGNWHVRYNAAVSLEARDLDYSALIEVVGGRDRYAREMMMYRLETKQIEAEDERREAPCETSC